MLLAAPYKMRNAHSELYGGKLTRISGWRLDPKHANDLVMRRVACTVDIVVDKIASCRYVLHVASRYVGHQRQVQIAEFDWQYLERWHNSWQS